MHAPWVHIRRALRTRRLVALAAAGAVGMLVVLALATSRPGASAAAATGPMLSVDAAAGQQPISPLVYGMNFASDQASTSEASAVGLPIDRWGGNTTDTYNWQLDSSNLGNDWYFENVADCFSAAGNYCNNGAGPNISAYQQFIDGDRAIGAQTLLTLPLMGYVAKDAPFEHPFTCGFPATTFSAQDGFDPYDSNCGNGTEGGTALASDPTRDGVAIDPASNASGWVNALVARYGTAAHGGVGYYELGNEPALWNSTHRDMNPAATTYDELWQKSETTAAAVKAVDPSAKVLAFSEWGWPNYFCSADDGDLCTASSPDRAAHGGLPIVAWLLSQAHAYDVQHGGRLFDYLDLHYYRAGGETTDVTRSLWDPTYTDPSWVNSTIELTPRMRQWVSQYDPGLGLSLSEYNLSIDTSQANYAVTNALIQADTLGIFAREGVGIATRWALSNDGPDIADAFDMYRDYDGKGSRFGDTYVRSQSTDQGSLAVYGATRASDGALTAMVINKTAAAATWPLSLSGFQPAASAQTWRWTGGAIVRAPDQALDASGFTATYPADSITLYVIPPAATTSTTTTSTTSTTTTSTTSTTTTSTTSTTTTSTTSVPTTTTPSSTTASTMTQATSTTTVKSTSTTTTTSAGRGRVTARRRPTRAQLLARALAACHKVKNRARRARCVSAAHRRSSRPRHQARRTSRRG